jgi:succinate dehydrogenase flavin-adding protein (antitoxin of CptAB toxin-antitoxin module)
VTIKQKREKEIDNTYKTKIKYKCPKRGWVEEEVTITRYETGEKVEGKHSYSFIEEEKEEVKEEV